MLDDALEEGMHVLVGLAWEQHVAFLQEPYREREIAARAARQVRECERHPAILGYALGNEIPAGIVRWHGGGTYLLRDRLQAEPLETMIERRRRLPDVLDARDALETKLAALAAVRRSDEDLTEIDAALAAMGDAVDRGELGVDEDQRFHAAVTAFLDV